MIETIQLENFKNHADTTINLGGLTAIVGPNGSGKTSVLQSIHHLARVARENQLKGALDLERVRNELVRRGTNYLSITTSGTLESSKSSNSEKESWLIRINPLREPESTKDSSVNEYFAEVRWAEEHFQAEYVNKSLLPPTEAREGILSTIGSARLHRLAPNQMRGMSSMREPYGRLSRRGQNLASVLAYCMTTERDRYEQIEEIMGSIIPSITGIRTQPDGSDRYELLFDTVSGQGIKADHVSEGALMTLGVVTALTGTDENGSSQLVMLDGLETSLHPRAQRDLVHQLKKVTDQKANAQILFTTHSPYIVDELSPDEVCLLNTDEEGIAHAKRLSEHPDVDRALDILTTGEFWSAEGEDWVVDNAAGDGHSSSPDTASTSDQPARNS
jgi:predicted ATPase